MSHPMPYTIRRLMAACLLAAGLAACDPGDPKECFSNEECTAPGEMCDEASNACVPAPDAGCVPGDELCNGQDDDCDGATDEGFDTGAVCTVGQGICEASGVQVCAADGVGVVCSVEPGPPEAEACNRRDDDCDGAADEGFATGEPCTAGVGACETSGQTICGPEGGTVCSAVPRQPADEACNAIDDDCDGTPDEGFDLGEACTAGIGTCAADGVTVCADDGSATCDAEPGQPAEETCNGLDDDCSGVVDEGFDLGADCTVGIGACAVGGSTVCGDDEAAACDAVAGEPGEETCNGIDDDCDGTVDEAFPGQGEPCEDGVGACLTVGAVACVDGARICLLAGEPIAPGEPGVEACNDIDDDCDGNTDEDFALGEICTEGVGACAAEGLTVCAADGDGTVCDAEPGAPAAERCDDIDDDCDGEVDEDFPLGDDCAVGVGVCVAESAFVCGDDGDVVCPVQPGEPGVEACDGTDADCDGITDETFAGQGDPCAEGVGACLTEGVVACVAGAQDCVDAEGAPVLAGQPSDEICNDIDDDCDASTDEDFPLGDACEEGQGVCLAAGVWICGGDGAAECDTEPGVGGDEVCNGLDDDCNGEVDDVPPTPCLAGTGECLAEGDLNCVDGEFVCDAVADAPAPEVCNDLDDDCDGRPDEGLGHPCHPFVLRGGRVTWAAGTSLSADRQWRLEGRGVALDGRTLRDGANQYRLTGGVLKTVGGLEMEGQ